MKITKIIAVLFLLINIYWLLSPQPAYAKIRNCLLFDQVDWADFLILGECTEVSNDSIAVEYSFLPGKVFRGPRYGTYKVLQSWKNYPGGEYYTCDFLRINEAVEPDVNFFDELPDGRTPYQPEIGQLACIFIKDGGFLNNDYYGFAVVDNEMIEKFDLIETITKLEHLSKLNPLARIKVFLDLLRNNQGFFTSCVKIALFKLPGQYYIDHFDEFMHSDSERVRSHTLWAIGKDIDQIKPTFFVKIEPLLQDTSSHIRYSAYSRLIQSNPEYYNQYFTTNYDNFMIDIKCKIIDNIAQQKDAECLEIFYKAATDNDIELRAAGIRALRFCDDDRAIQIIYSSMNDTHPEVQLAGITSATYHLKPILINYARWFLRSSAPNMKRAAIYALRTAYIHFHDYPEFINRDGIISTLLDIARSKDSVDIRMYSIYVLREIQPSIIPDLYAELLYDSSSTMKNNIIIRMGDSGNNQYIPLLDEILADETDSLTINNIKAAIIELDKISPSTNYSSRIQEILNYYRKIIKSFEKKSPKQDIK